ncbi:MAG: hypothetical protein KDB37_16185 [Ilumatobacter sp.]|nr:hypothetical protein [Ilumatobacter sp.]
MAGRDGRRLLGRVPGDAGGANDDGVDERDAFDRVTFTDEELTELALDASPFDPFDPDVEPFEPPA